MNNKNIWLKTIIVVFLLGLAGCSGSDEYGSGVDPDLPVVKVRDLLLNPELEGTRLTIHGSIVNLCASRGCWLYIQDDTGRIFVNLAPADITLPFRQGQTVGKQAWVSGIMRLDHGQPIMEAQGLEVR